MTGFGTDDAIAPRLPKRSATLAGCVLTGLLIAAQSFHFEMVPPRFDAARYAQYALNLHDYGVFGLAIGPNTPQPVPGYANSPLYPALLAALVSFDPQLDESLRCAVDAKPETLAQCPQQYELVVATQITLAAVALLCLWLASWYTFSSKRIAWVTSLLAAGSGQALIYANQLLTEILVLSWFSLLLLVIVLAMQRNRRRWCAIAGVLLGLLTLTRPEYVYPIYLVIAAAVMFAVVKRGRRIAAGLAIAALSAMLTLSPWALRNLHHFDDLAITGGYADVIVAYRVSYNRLTLADWTAAFVYFVSQHTFEGVARIYPRAAHGSEIESYLIDHGPAIRERALAALHGDRSRLTQYLVETEILARPLQHLTTSILLAGRGVMVGKYLAILGLPSLALMMYVAWRKRAWQMFVLLSPALVMVPLYAGVSVSIPRYNVYLVYYYAMAGAWLLSSLLIGRTQTFFTFEANNQAL